MNKQSYVSLTVPLFSRFGVDEGICEVDTVSRHWV